MSLRKSELKYQVEQEPAARPPPPSPPNYVTPLEVEIPPEEVPPIPDAGGSWTCPEEETKELAVLPIGEAMKKQREEMTMLETLKEFCASLQHLVLPVLLSVLLTLLTCLVGKEGAVSALEYSTQPDVFQFLDFNRTLDRLQPRLASSLHEGQVVVLLEDLFGGLLYFQPSSQSGLPMGDPERSGLHFAVGLLNITAAFTLIVPLVYFLAQPFKKNTVKEYLKAAWAHGKAPLALGFLLFIVVLSLYVTANKALVYDQKAVLYYESLNEGYTQGFSIFLRLQSIFTVLLTLYLRFSGRNRWAFSSFLIPFMVMAFTGNILNSIGMRRFGVLDNDAERTLYRVVVFPVCTELLLFFGRVALRFVVRLPPLLMSSLCLRRVPSSVIDKSCSLLMMVPPMVMISVTGRVMLSSLTSPGWVLLSNALLLLMELAFRASLGLRDRFGLAVVSRIKEGSRWREGLADLLGDSQSVEFRCMNLWLVSIMEYLAICSGCVFVYVLNVNPDPSAPPVSLGAILFNFCVQILSEVATDFLCFLYEVRSLQLPLVKAWKSRPPQFLLGLSLLVCISYFSAVKVSSHMLCLTKKEDGVVSTLFC